MHLQQLLLQLSSPREDELAGDAPRASTDDSLTFTLAVFFTSTKAPALALAPIFGTVDMYTKMDLQRATKPALKLFAKGQEYAQLQANIMLRNRFLKAKEPLLTIVLL